jgi:hypothetical protein
MDALTAQAALVDQVEREKANEIKDKAKGASFFFSLTKSRTKRKVHLDDDVLVCSQYCKCEKSCTAHGHTRTMKSHTHTHTHTHTGWDPEFVEQRASKAKQRREARKDILVDPNPFHSSVSF